MSFSKGPELKSVDLKEHVKDQVAFTADIIAETAGEAVLAATEEMETPVSHEGEAEASSVIESRGRIIESSKDSFSSLDGREMQITSVKRKPSLFQRIFRKGTKDVDLHKIAVDPSGQIAHTTVRPSVLGGRVEKTARVGKDVNGADVVSYSVARYDAKGRKVIRESREKVPHKRHSGAVFQGTVGDDVREAREDREINAIKDLNYRNLRRKQVEDRRKREKREREAVLNTAYTISERVQGALVGDLDDIGPAKTPKKVDDLGREASQVPKGAAKYARGYQKKNNSEPKVEDLM